LGVHQEVLKGHHPLQGKEVMGTQEKRITEEVQQEEEVVEVNHPI